MNSVETILLENIDNPNSLFIFPTDIAASQWADRLLRLKGGAIAMSKFTAWDKFKQNSVKSKVKDKKSIPSSLRKIFISRLIRENAEAVTQGKTPIFSSLINEEWAFKAGHFTSWLTGILPQLGIWFNKITNHSLSIDDILSAEAEKKASGFEGDDRDMYVLAFHYALFLKTYSLFEPAWETPPFNNDGKECFLFFPESLSDYSEYKHLLSESSHVKIISADNTEKIPFDTFYYSNSRREITEASLYIRALHEKQNIPWDGIAVCIPDYDSYEPYVLREFTNRNIPFVKRTSKPLSDYPAGQFFRSILDCADGNFSFSSMVSLVMNRNLPWKDTLLTEKLIQFGINNNCLYSWEEQNEKNQQMINVWDDAFKNPYKHLDNDVRKYFNDLKKRVSSFRSSESFSELCRQYFIFREMFFDMAYCTEETDLVLSRCISELMDLVELEKAFPEVPVIDPFLFLSEHLSEVNYLAQSKISGVAVLPYKTAACALFDCHIVLGAGQESISIVYPRLTFLPRLKRKELGITDEEASEAYIHLHIYNSIKKAAFFCSEQTFSDYAIPHSKINAPAKARDRYAEDPQYEELFSCDNYNIESSFCSSLSLAEIPKTVKLHENQANGFNQWKKRRYQINTHNKNWKIYDEVKKSINSIYSENGKSNISATTMHHYNKCSLNWLFERVYQLENIQIETSLMDNNISGSVYHAIFDNFFSEIKKGETPLLAPVQNEMGSILPPSYQKLLKDSVDSVFNSLPSLKQGKESKMSSLTARLLKSAKGNYQNHCEQFIAHFLSFFAGCSVAGCEKYYQIEKDSYILKGFTDILLKDSSEKHIIVDYKIKYLPNRKDCNGEGENGLSNFQLPVYITLVEENEEYNVYTALFYSILDLKPEVIFGAISDVNTNKSFPYRKSDKIERESEQYKLIFDELNKKTIKFANEISSGNFTVFPKKAGDCFGCNYHRICRTVYVIDRETNYISQE